jgi:hypothetical protein
MRASEFISRPAVGSVGAEGAWRTLEVRPYDAERHRRGAGAAGIRQPEEPRSPAPAKPCSEPRRRE